MEYQVVKIGKGKSTKRRVWIRVSSVLGYKNEPYYKTEKEMLEDKIYNYASLSESEKGIYTKIKKDGNRQSNI
tara:strand:- start:248 stop:466 length:219 start_codon:yes stop_codon:yes gene_type:complete